MVLTQSDPRIIYGSPMLCISLFCNTTMWYSSTMVPTCIFGGIIMSHHWLRFEHLFST